MVVGACLVLAAISLLLPGAPTYDPWAWIIWGREIVEWDLDTRQGPSWKPLPVLFTVPFAALGNEVAPDLWLLVSRAGGLLAIAMAYRLGARLAGRGAGVVAAVALAVSDSFVRHFWRGFSEGLLVGLALWAFERHLAGRRVHAFGLGVAAGLLRPEVWPFLAVYGLYLLRREPRRLGLVAGAALVTLAAWFVPEYLGSGDFLRAANRAMDANIGSAAYADHPWLEVFTRSSGLLLPPVLALAVVAVVLRPRDAVVRSLAAGTLVLMAVVAAMTQAGFAGNLRYVALPAALVCILAGVGAVGLVARWGARAAVVIAVVSIPFVVAVARDLEQDAVMIRSEADFYQDAELAIERAGGPSVVNACGAVFTGRFEVPVLAWALHRHVGEVRIHSYPPGHVFGGRHTALASDPRFEPVAETTKWVVRRRCPAS